MFCSNCGAGIGVDGSFCAKCGFDLKGTSILLPAVAMAAPMPVQHVPSAPPLVFSSSTRRTEVKRSSGAVTASWILLVFACAGALIPGLGFAMWAIIAPILLITLVLGVLAISKGQTISGVMIILMSLVVVPVFVAIAPFVGTLLAFGAAEGVNQSVSTQETSVVEQVAAPEDGVLGLDLGADVPVAPESSLGAGPVIASAAAPASREQAVQAVQADPTPRPQPAAEDRTGSESMPNTSAVVAGSVEYAVLRTQPTLFSKGLGRLAAGTAVTLGAEVPGGEWIAATTSDGREGFLRRSELDVVN